MTSCATDIVLGVCGGAGTCRDGAWYVHHSVGRVVDALAVCVGRLRYYGPQATPSAASHCDYRLESANIEVELGPMWHTSVQAIKRAGAVLRHYSDMARTCNALFLRGSLPFLWAVLLMAGRRRLPVVYWVVGNPVAVIKGERRGYGSVMTAAILQYARFDRIMTKAALRISRAHVLANGAELASIFRSPRTVEVVSTSISEQDSHSREDTCQEPTIRLVFVGFIRPEKGLEYLLRAMPQLQVPKPVHLAVVGSWEQFSTERDRLISIIDQLGLGKRVTWEGYAAFGSDLFRQLDRSDILVLPSLSEGTPRVLIEARARSLPVVATNVGGIPSSVVDGEDGLLVPPRDPTALAAAISRIIRDGDLRRRLIHTGRDNVRMFTTDRFGDLVMRLLTTPGTGRPGQQPQAVP